MLHENVQNTFVNFLQYVYLLIRYICNYHLFITCMLNVVYQKMTVYVVINLLLDSS